MKIWTLLYILILGETLNSDTQEGLEVFFGRGAGACLVLRLLF